MYWQFLKAVLLFHWSRSQFYCLKIEKSSWNHFFRLAAGLVCQKSPFVKKTTWTAIFRAAASFTRYLDQNHSLFLSKAANRALKFIKHKHENTGAGHIFKKCVLAPKPPYLNRAVSYEDDQVVIYHGILSLIHFPVSNYFLAFIFNFNCVLQRQ